MVGEQKLRGKFVPRPSKGCFLEVFSYSKTTNKHGRVLVETSGAQAALVISRCCTNISQWWGKLSGPFGGQKPTFFR